MAPPLFARRDKETGHLRKNTYGPWMFPLLKILAGLRFLRGTPFDPFGYTAERKREMALIRQYEQTLQEILEGLTHENHPLAVEILSLPQLIRGFGHVKERNQDAADRRLQELMAAWRRPEERKNVA